MKPQSPSPKGKQKRAGKAPKARLYWMHREVFPLELTEKQTEEDEYPVAVLPAETAKQAKALVAFANLSEEEKRQKIIDTMRDQESRCDEGWEPGIGDLADELLQATGHIAGRDK